MTVEAGASTKAKAAADGWMNWVRKVEPFGLIIVWIAMIAVFGYLRPETFLTWANFSTLLGSQAVLVVHHAGVAGSAHRQRFRSLDRLHHDAFLDADRRAERQQRDRHRLGDHRRARRGRRHRPDLL